MFLYPLLALDLTGLRRKEKGLVLQQGGSTIYP